MTAQTTTAWTACRTFDALKRHFRMSDQKIAVAAGEPYTRSKVTDRRLGRTALDTNDFDTFGQVFGVPSSVFLMGASEAIRWVLDHPDTGPDQGTRQSGWTPVLVSNRAA